MRPVLNNHTQQVHRFGNPKGIVSTSPGLRGTSYPGWLPAGISTPTGLRPVSTVQPQPRWGCFPLSRFPKVARASQPWALSRNPFGIYLRNSRKTCCLGRFLLLAAGLFAHLTASGQTSTNDAISREVSVFNSGLPSATTITTNAEAISREVSVFNSGLPSAATITTNVEAISRELSVFNSGLPSSATITTNVEAISRELSMFNFGVPPVVFAIGSTNALGDEANQVPFTLQTVLDLTNLSLTVQTDDSHLHILGVTPSSPEVVSMVLGTANSNGLPIAFTLNPAAIPTTNHVLAWLNFQGITNLDSAIVPLTITHFSTTRSSGQVVPAATANGQVILIVSKPILVVSGKPQFGITLYGLPGATYAIETTTNLASPGWHELERLLESGRVLTLTGLTNNAAQQFYRTEQVGP